MITVLVVETRPLQRFGFRMLLENTPDIEIVGEVENCAEAVRWTIELHPDVVLMNIRMPDGDGIEATRRIVAAGGRSRILLLTLDVDRNALAALRAGASGFLLKDTRPDELLAGIRAVAAGDAVIAPALTRRLLDAFADRIDDELRGPVQRQDPRLDSLTEREREVFVAIGHGLTNGEIAQRFTLSESTVKTHVGRVLAKIGARDRIQAVTLAYDLRLARPV
ncbi:response regulator transcription factor [Verrucosispora sp. WMMD1129]|uniref:response regulator n=1 Tax=Verrucosispora sp. WMMD1129 TaxID=3016093 RepID=UPI00249BF089|nr:response regulator transcription factor [Verrucosispora sp. WMMD1129]WFE47754.1 response regulator transcription factor [Verrucosispora sp. WMMD1129]